MVYRYNISLKEEIKEIAIADLVLSIAFTLALFGGVFGHLNLALMLEYFPAILLIVTLTFVLHELMHRQVARKFGAIASFQYSINGLLITIVTGMIGFLFGVTGATVIYTNSFTKREEGLVSIAGPLTNFAIFFIFLFIYLSLFVFKAVPSVLSNEYLFFTLSFGMFISVLLAFFNMLPIMPLDGAKVLKWNKSIYMVSMIFIFISLGFSYFILTGSIVDMFIEVIAMIILASIFSLFYRSVI